MFCASGVLRFNVCVLLWHVDHNLPAVALRQLFPHQYLVLLLFDYIHYVNYSQIINQISNYIVLILVAILCIGCFIKMIYWNKIDFIRSKMISMVVVRLQATWKKLLVVLKVTSVLTSYYALFSADVKINF